MKHSITVDSRLEAIKGAQPSFMCSLAYQRTNTWGIIG